MWCWALCECCCCMLRRASEGLDGMDWGAEGSALQPRC